MIYKCNIQTQCRWLVQLWTSAAGSSFHNLVICFFAASTEDRLHPIATERTKGICYRAGMFA